MTDKVILDSSIWIDIKRGDARVNKIVSPLIEEDKVILTDRICAEVLRGAKSNKDYSKLKEIFSNFTTLSANWEEVAFLGYLVARKGFNPPLADLYIATCAISAHCQILTRDKHFLSIKSVRNFKLKLI